jgi:hypothetical protein
MFSVNLLQTIVSKRLCLLYTCQQFRIYIIFANFTNTPQTLTVVIVPYVISSILAVKQCTMTKEKPF